MRISGSVFNFRRGPSFAVRRRGYLLVFQSVDFLMAAAVNAETDRNRFILPTNKTQGDLKRLPDGSFMIPDHKDSRVVFFEYFPDRVILVNHDMILRPRRKV